jgi:hypothetical protein
MLLEKQEEQVERLEELKGAAMKTVSEETKSHCDERTSILTVTFL